jgi:hypothetical protein
LRDKIPIWRFCLWFPRAIKAHNPKFQRQWFGPYKFQYCLPNNTMLLVIIDKFDPNPILVNINKLKPYRFVKDHTFQLVLIKPSDFLSKEQMEATHFDNLFIKQPIEVTESIETNYSNNVFDK